MAREHKLRGGGKARLGRNEDGDFTLTVLTPVSYMLGALGGGRYELYGARVTFAVDLGKRTCSCAAHWDRGECTHLDALRALRNAGELRGLAEGEAPLRVVPPPEKKSS
jgi:hypothetical protein